MMNRMREWMNRAPGRLDSPLLPLLITTIVLSLFTFSILRRSGFNAAALVTAGDIFCDPAAVPPGLPLLQNWGYDGQFYYRLALDPFTSKRTDFGITLDDPLYRHQRIFYPLMAWAMSAGRADLVPWAMLFINFSALCLLGWLGGVYAQTFKQHALWGLFLALYPASLLSLTRDLVDLLEVTLLVSSLLMLRRGKSVCAAVLLTLAVLTKETALIVAVVAMLGYAFDRNGRQEARKRWYYFTLPIVIFLIWQTALRINWGEFPIIIGKSALGIPFAGLVRLLLDVLTLQTPLQRRLFPELILLSVFVFGVIYYLRATTAEAHLIFSWILYLVLVLSASRVVWADDWGYLRASSEFCALGVIIIIAASSRARARARAMIFGSISVIWLFNFVRLLRHDS
ncbi:MAG: hypothetical protein J2P21_20195 [Chloracidobacterium sp.]|nr:hypothetical protein [Chloracidobacterium sp.]